MSYCPSILLAIAGPWFCVMGGVYHKKAIIQPITDYVWMGDDPYDDEYLSKTARILYAIRLASSNFDNITAH